jgi:hypothetical protein
MTTSTESNYPVDRDSYYTEIFTWFLNQIGCSETGIYSKSTNFDHNGYENEIFRVSPFCWCLEDGGCKNCHMPNFWYKPDNFQIRWYKYPFRDSYSNKPFNLEYFVKILIECEKSWFDDRLEEKYNTTCECGQKIEKNLYRCWECAKKINK